MKGRNSFFFHGLTAAVGLGFLTVQVSRSHSDTPHSVGLLWTSDKPDAETSTWQHTTITTDRYPWTRRDSDPQPIERAVTVFDTKLIQRGKISGEKNQMNRVRTFLLNVLYLTQERKFIFVGMEKLFFVQCLYRSTEYRMSGYPAVCHARIVPYISYRHHVAFASTSYRQIASCVTSPLHVRLQKWFNWCA
jgi:hypothetical protein